MSEVITTSANALPAPMPPNMERGLRVFKTRLTEVGLGYEIYAVDAPTQEQRDGLERRSARLSTWLAPSGNEAAIKREVASVLGTMAVRTGSEVDAEVMLRIYVRDLLDIPLFAITAACADFRRGAVGDKRWAPTQAEIREVASRHVAKLAKEKREIDMVLNAKVVPKPSDQEHRKAVIARELARLKDMREAGRAAEEARQNEERRVREAEAKAARTRAGLDSGQLPPASALTEGQWLERAKEASSRLAKTKLDPTILAQFPRRQADAAE